VELRPDAAAPLTGRTATREVRILLERPELDVTWSRFAGGERGADLHVHHEHVDGFYVLEGDVTFRVGPDAERVVAGPGTAVLVPPGVVHGFDNDSDGTAAWLNFHAPSTGFAAYLRGERDGFDSTDPPADGGRPAADAIIAADATHVGLDALTLEVADVPAERWFVLGDGRVLNVHVG
jgi:quercetin dioxygenase-like cupin family protein